MGCCGMGDCMWRMLYCLPRTFTSRPRRRGQTVSSRRLGRSKDAQIHLVFALTQRELWRVVIDIGEGDFDLCCSRQSSHVTAHVFGLDHHVVFLASLAVHVGQGGTDYAWMGRRFHCRLNSTVHVNIYFIVEYSSIPPCCLRWMWRKLLQNVLFCKEKHNLPSVTVL